MQLSETLMHLDTPRYFPTLAALALACAFGLAHAQAGKHKLPAGDPCTVVPLAEVQKAFPGAKAGVRDRHLEEYGSTQCAWSDSRGQVVFGVQESYGSNTAMQEAKGQATAFLDPLASAAKANVRYETLSGIAPEAVAFVEAGDRKRGILGDGSLLVLRKGQHTLTLMSPELPKRDRAAALKVYEDLGRIAAKRLD
jgi:hypothetical protein